MFMLFAPLLGRWMSEKVSGAVSGLITVALLCGFLWGFYSWSWDRGRDHERSAWQAKVEQVREKRQKTADDAADADAKTAAEAATPITETRKEIDNATANLPDQGLSARQRARACAELRRQGRGC
jgi:hypothetical protein